MSNTETPTTTTTRAEVIAMAQAAGWKLAHKSIVSLTYVKGGSRVNFTCGATPRKPNGDVDTLDNQRIAAGWVMVGLLSDDPKVAKTIVGRHSEDLGYMHTSDVASLLAAGEQAY